MGSSSQASTTGGSSHPSIETPNVDMHDGDDSFSSTTPTSGPSSYGFHNSKRQKMSRTSSPTPSGSQDTKMYEFIDSMISKHGEEKYTGYKKKISDFCKVLASVMEEIPESYFNDYMQECLKTLNNYQTVIPVSYVETTDIIPNVVNFTDMSQVQFNQPVQFNSNFKPVQFNSNFKPVQFNSNFKPFQFHNSKHLQMSPQVQCR